MAIGPQGVLQIARIEEPVLAQQVDGRARDLVKRRAIAEPISPAAPVISATRRLSLFSGGASVSLYNSRGQYSAAKASLSKSDW